MRKVVALLVLATFFLVLVLVSIAHQMLQVVQPENGIAQHESDSPRDAGRENHIGQDRGDRLGPKGRDSSEIVSVQDEPYAAVGDGQTDDTDALIAAVRSADDLFVPDGEYLITEALQVQSGQRITLAQEAHIKFHGRVKPGPGSDDRVAIFCVCDVEDVAITGGTLADASDWDAHGIWTTGLWIRGARSVVVEDVRLQNFRMDGVYIDRWSEGEGEDVFSSDVVLETIRIDGVGRNGISVPSGRDIEIVDAHVENWLGLIDRGTGIHMEPNGADHPLHGIRIEDLRAVAMEEVLRVNLGAREAAGGHIDIVARQPVGIDNVGDSNYVFRNADGELSGRVVLESPIPHDVQVSNWNSFGPRLDVSEPVGGAVRSDSEQPHAGARWGSQNGSYPW